MKRPGSLLFGLLPVIAGFAFAWGLRLVLPLSGLGAAAESCLVPALYLLLVLFLGRLSVQFGLNSKLLYLIPALCLVLSLVRDLLLFSVPVLYLLPIRGVADPFLNLFLFLEPLSRVLIRLGGSAQAGTAILAVLANLFSLLVFLLGRRTAERDIKNQHM